VQKIRDVKESLIHKFIQNLDLPFSIFVVQAILKGMFGVLNNSFINFTLV
jgi:hypothetical protein